MVTLKKKVPCSFSSHGSSSPYCSKRRESWSWRRQSRAQRPTYSHSTKTQQPTSEPSFSQTVHFLYWIHPGIHHCCDVSSTAQSEDRHSGGNCVAPTFPSGPGALQGPLLCTSCLPKWQNGLETPHPTKMKHERANLMPPLTWPHAPGPAGQLLFPLLYDSLPQAIHLPPFWIRRGRRTSHGILGVGVAALWTKLWDRTQSVRTVFILKQEANAHQSQGPTILHHLLAGHWYQVRVTSGSHLALCLTPTQHFSSSGEETGSLTAATHLTEPVNWTRPCRVKELCCSGAGVSKRKTCSLLMQVEDEDKKQLQEPPSQPHKQQTEDAPAWQQNGTQGGHSYGPGLRISRRPWAAGLLLLPTQNQVYNQQHSFLVTVHMSGPHELCLISICLCSIEWDRSRTAPFWKTPQSDVREGGNGGGGRRGVEGECPGAESWNEVRGK
jgi:hypothetical protein